MTCPRSLHYKTTTCPKGFSLAGGADLLVKAAYLSTKQ